MDKAAFYEGHKTFSVRGGPAVPPGPGEVRLQVAYVGICGTDVHIWHGAMDQRVRIPQVIGHEMSGTVAELGDGVTGLQPGDPVVVRPLDPRAETPADRGYSHICQKLKFIGIDSPGAFQSSWTVPAFTVHKLPAGVDLKTGALAEPLAVACHDVKRGEVRPGELAVVIGGGPIGMFVAMVARQAGARVVISELSPFRLAFARRLRVFPQPLDKRLPVDSLLSECRTTGGLGGFQNGGGDSPQRRCGFHGLGNFGNWFWLGLHVDILVTVWPLAGIRTTRQQTMRERSAN